MENNEVILNQFRSNVQIKFTKCSPKDENKGAEKTIVYKKELLRRKLIEFCVVHFDFIYSIVYPQIINLISLTTW